jgi:antitoxin CcdA
MERKSESMTKKPILPPQPAPQADKATADRAACWLRENAEAIRSYNAYVEAHGLPLARFRQF